MASFLSRSWTYLIEDEAESDFPPAVESYMVLSSVGMENYRPDKTPAAEFPLGAELDSSPMHENWSYASNVGMLL